MKKIRIFLIIIICLFYSKIAFSLSIIIKAKVQNEIITNIDIENEKQYLFFLNPKLKELDKKRTDEISKNSLITEIIKRIELEKIFDLNKQSDLTEIAEKQMLIKKKIENKSEFLKILKEKKLNYETVKKKLQIESMWGQLIYKKNINNIKINKNDLRKRILKQANMKKKKYEYNLSEIVIEINYNDNLNKKINTVKKSIKDIGFENTANIYSISSTAKNGGIIGWINELQISEKINKSVKTIEVNNITEPIQIPTGYIILKLNDKREFNQEINLDEQLEKLEMQETSRQLNNFSIIFYKRLKKNIEINEY